MSGDVAAGTYPKMNIWRCEASNFVWSTDGVRLRRETSLTRGKIRYIRCVTVENSMVHIWRKTLNQPCAIPSLLFNQRKRSLITALAKKTVVPLFGKSGVSWRRTTWHKRTGSLFLTNQLATRAFTPTARSMNDFTQPVQGEDDCPTEG